MRLFGLIIVSLLVLSNLGCKKTPTDPPIPAPELNGTYVGWGRPGNSGYNVRLEFHATDSASWDSEIFYGGFGSSVSVTELSSDEDSVRLEYTRGTTYRLLGVVSNAAIHLYVLEPSGQPTYVLNKETAGYNLSGEWDGAMYSQLLQTTQPADLFLDQQGTFYDGSVQVQFGIYTLLGQINQGAIQDNGIYFGGTASFDGNRYPFRFDGEFVTQDSIAGYWQLNVTGGSDAGEFGFSRRF